MELPNYNDQTFVPKVEMSVVCETNQQIVKVESNPNQDKIIHNQTRATVMKAHMVRNTSARRNKKSTMAFGIL